MVRTGVLALALLTAVALLPTLIRHWRRPGKLAPHAVHTLLSQDAPPLVLDVRSPKEFVGVLGHIDGAVLLPLPELEGRLSELLPHRRRPIVAV
jgi:rhodanese-related sulfurtransferase